MLLKSLISLASILFDSATGTYKVHVPHPEKGCMRDWTGYQTTLQTRLSRLNFLRSMITFVIIIIIIIIITFVLLACNFLIIVEKQDDLLFLFGVNFFFFFFFGFKKGGK
ncbi:hypothetical protein CsSME_00032956 [Camellia sinensis var. sinensis]